MKKQIAVPFAALAFIAAFVVGCGKTSNLAQISATPTPIPIPTATCTPVPGETVALAYPENGATNVPSLTSLASPSPGPSVNGIALIVAPTALPTNFYVYVTQTSPTATPAPQTGPTVLPSTLPSPIATLPAIAGAQYEYFDIGQFGTPTLTYYVYYANTSCFPGIQLGSFTTGNT